MGRAGKRRSGQLGTARDSLGQLSMPNIICIAHRLRYACVFMTHISCYPASPQKDLRSNQENSFKFKIDVEGEKQKNICCFVEG